MKIKTVCEVTGLTDRTIRYYIEERLISPTYTENYLGRKAFDFSDKDIDTLKHISLLRRFDFTIEEIRRIIVDASSSNDIISDVKRRTEEAVSQGEEKLRILSRLHSNQAYTLEQLAEELSKPPISLPEHKELAKRNPKKTVFALVETGLTLLLVWAPFVFSLFGVISSFRENLYPVFNTFCIAGTLVTLLPSVAVLLLSRAKRVWTKIVKWILLFLCILSFPINFLFSCCIISKSETMDIRNYCKFDPDCSANRNLFFDELFPDSPHYFVSEKQPNGNYKTVYLDAHYYYCNRIAMDYTYDIYAQWPLEEEEFNKEVSRVQALYESHTTEPYYKYEIIQQGNYTCLFRYSCYADTDVPFEEVTDSYTYYIFAYDETNLVVRYITCYSLADDLFQPFYLSLDW